MAPEVTVGAPDLSVFCDNSHYMMYIESFGIIGAHPKLAGLSRLALAGSAHNSVSPAVSPVPRAEMPAVSSHSGDRDVPDPFFHRVHCVSSPWVSVGHDRDCVAVLLDTGQ